MRRVDVQGKKILPILPFNPLKLYFATSGARLPPPGDGMDGQEQPEDFHFLGSPVGKCF